MIGEQGQGMSKDSRGEREERGITLAHSNTILSDSRQGNTLIGHGSD
jgi:hypothetical protein